MRKVLIMGAAGRDFHNFNVFFKQNKSYNVVCFTATQIPDIDDRRYPKELSGPHYPNGIPIYPESQLTYLIKRHKIDVVVFSYSDISHNFVMHKASEAIAAGADYWLLGPQSSMIRSRKKVIAVCAARTGSGKSQTTRRICEILKDNGISFSVIRHPMPYGDLRKQIVQKFETYSDLEKHHCTIEEREEYEPHIKMGHAIFAGVDYGLVLKEAEKTSQVIIWDGGNNDLPFYAPDLHIVVVDPLRAGNESTYHPGEANVRMADIVIINKIDSAPRKNVGILRDAVKNLNKHAIIIEAASPTIADKPELIRNKRVVVVEDGPTLTHGEMSFGAGVVASKRYKAKAIVDPRKYFVGSIQKALVKYPHIGALIPALGYSAKQIIELEKTINSTPADSIVMATPIDLRRFMKLNKPVAKIEYALKEKNRALFERTVLRCLKLK
jgi:predicted GTPase